MVPTNRPSRPVAERFSLISGIVCLGILFSGAISVAQPETFGIKFSPLSTAGKAVTAPDSRYIVSVYQGSGELTGEKWIKGNRVSQLKLAGRNKLTRLCFFTNPSSSGKSAGTWVQGFGTGGSQALRAITDSAILNCRFEKWVTQVGDKVLPLGLLNVSFQKKIPASGTPLIDSKRNIVGLILQPSSRRSAYAIPAQAVHRVPHDIGNHQKLVRGWMGLSLSTESSIPRITRIWPGSPAEKSKLRENDILVKAGSYPTARYPDAVNSLFYAIPGESTAIEITRGDKRIATMITPTVQKPGN